ncbi:MAG TPA: ScyD/ScyE family protein [Pyrinomonadaceae bacterium]
MKRKNIIIMTFALVAVVGAILGPIPFGSRAVSAQTDHAGVSVVVDGLHSPRGLSFGPGNILYIGEAGDEGHAGSIIQVINAMSQNPTTHTLVNSLSTVGDEGEFLGLGGISVLGRGTNADIYAIMSLSPEITGNNAFGNLFKVDSQGAVQNIANVGSYDFQWTADHSGLWEEFPDTNPYGVLAVPGHIYVADAGANTLNEVLADGSVRVLAYFPNEIIRDAIPTCVAQGPDKALYVGTLALVDTFVFGPSAKVYRVDPSQANLSDPTATPMTLWTAGLWPINGCTFGSDGTFYASQLFTNPNINDDFDHPMGDVVKIPFADPSSHTFLTGGGLSFAGGVAVGPNGSVFVSDGTAFVPEGRVVRLNQ